MAKKDRRKKKEKAREVSLGGIDAAMARKMIERDIAAIEKIASEREFESEDELKELLQRFVSSDELGKRIANGPSEEAQELIYRAWGTRSVKTKINLARQALTISRDCVDAYVILAEEEARSVVEALKFYKAGIEAGERILGARAFTEDAGHFWGLMETRPYMRARAGLAQCLSALGKHTEAVEHYRDMLRLNPEDNQGVRYLLAACLLEMRDFAALQNILEQYRENTAAWFYTRALIAFIGQGDCPESRQRLVGALSCNRYVPSYLLGDKQLPKRLPEYMGFGDKNEAIIYAVEFGLGWLKIKGAITWLGSVYRDRQAAQQCKSKPVEIPEVFLKAFESEERAQPSRKASLAKIYTFRVSLKGYPRIWRKIEMKGTQTLHNLHQAIFKAFGRYEEHLYSFFLSNRQWDSSSEYSLPDLESNSRNAQKTMIGFLDLKVNKRFLYLFDFGVQWWHYVQLLDIKDEEAEGDYPRIVESKGTAPPQYPLMS